MKYSGHTCKMADDSGKEDDDEVMEIYDDDDDDDGVGDEEEIVCKDEMEQGSGVKQEKKSHSKKKGKSAKKGSAIKEEEKVYLPGDPIDEAEKLTYDSSAYVLYHEAQTISPCLSFDIIPDSLGDSRTEFPMTAYAVSGTQAAAGKQNHVIVMKMSDLHSTTNEDDSDSDDETLDEEPLLETVMIKHNGGINRIRHAPIPERHLVATWSERGQVSIWDISQQVISIDSSPLPMANSVAKDVKPIYTFSGHQSEGFAIDWSKLVHGKLATGDCHSNIHLWTPQEGGTWHVDQRPFNGHTGSVEDIQWSPIEQNVFASCSVDKTIRIWDSRDTPSQSCKLVTNAHETDVNVISWNRNEPFIVSGGDDGIIKIWDLRQFDKGESVAVFKHHTAPITSVEWHPSDASVFMASGADGQVTLWDLAVERDDTSEGPGRHLDVPPQLLFIHMGQKDIKEVHWHPQLCGVLITTAESGFNIFKTISL